MISVKFDPKPRHPICHNRRFMPELATMLEKIGLDRKLLRQALDLGLKSGGDFSEIFVERGIHSSINLEEDIIKETSEAVITGLSVRVLSGGKTGFGFTNDLAPERILKTSLTAAAISAGRRQQHFRRFYGRKGLPGIYSDQHPVHSASLNRKIALAREAYDSARNFDPAVVKVKVLLQDSFRELTIANSEGLFVSDSRPLVRLVCHVIAEKNGRRESGFWGGGGRVGLEYFRSSLSPQRIGEQAVREALALLEARDAPAGEMPIVLSAGHSGVLIHEAVGHLLEADFIRKKTSIFWNKLGRKVGSELVTIYDDPTIAGLRGSYALDDEGTTPEKVMLIERGRVCGFLQDRLSAGLMKMPLNGHGRREDFSYPPIPRMANTYIDNGPDDPEEILRSVKKGFYVQSLQGGEVEDSGKFTFSVSLGYLIENGRRTAPVKQATLVGTSTDILSKIEMVGNDLDFSLQTGTCGKEGQSVPVSDGCPTIKITAMTVGGIK